MSDLRTDLIRLAHDTASFRPPLVSLLEADRVARHRLDGVRRHTLMPANIKSKLPDLYSQEDEKDPTVHVKYFSPYMNATWLILEFDGRDRMFGWADLGHGMGELGYISLNELESLERNGLPMVERDLYFRPKPLSQAKHG